MLRTFDTLRTVCMYVNGGTVVRNVMMVTLAMVIQITCSFSNVSGLYCLEVVKLEYGRGGTAT
jgi:hypothetical protein